MTKTCANCGLPLDNDNPLSGRHDMPDECVRLLKQRGDTYRRRARILAERLRLARTTDKIVLEFRERTVEIMTKEPER